MDIPAAKQEIRTIIETCKSFPSKVEGEKYMDSFLIELSNRDEEKIRANFFALMEVVAEFYEEVMGIPSNKKQRITNGYFSNKIKST